jgi:hypothetical protein
MQDRAIRRLDADVSAGGDRVTIDVATTNLDRVDAYLDGRPVASEDVPDGRCTFVIPRAQIGERAELRLEGFADGTLGAARRLQIEIP